MPMFALALCAIVVALLVLTSFAQPQVEAQAIPVRVQEIRFMPRRH